MVDIFYWYHGKSKEISKLGESIKKKVTYAMNNVDSTSIVDMHRFLTGWYQACEKIVGYPHRWV